MVPGVWSQLRPKPYTRHLLVNLKKSSFPQKVKKLWFRLKLGRSRGVREERTDHTQLFRRTLAGFGLTWHRKVHFSTFSGHVTFQCTRNGIQNHPFCPGSLQDTFIIYSLIFQQHIFQTCFFKKKHLENRTSGNMEIQKPRFTNRSPVDTLTLFKKCKATKNRRTTYVFLGSC